jgi:hypothetical protein
MKFASALATTFPLDPMTKTSILDNPLFKFMKSSLKVSQPAPTRFDMNHDLDMSYVWEYLDKDGSDTLIPNETANPHLIQLRLIVSLVHDDQRRGADLGHILRAGCRVIPDFAIVLFSSLKSWTGQHEISYEKNPHNPPHRNTWDLLQAHLANWDTYVPERLRSSVTGLFLGHADNGSMLLPRAVLANTINGWQTKLLRRVGYPEFTAYQIVKACATEMVSADYVRDDGASRDGVTRWKSQRVMRRHYVKPNARVWKPIHLREDSHELTGEPHTSLCF